MSVNQNPKPANSATPITSVPPNPTVAYRPLLLAVVFSVLPLFPLWFSGVSCFAYRTATHVHVWSLQQGHGRQLYFHAEQGEFAHNAHNQQQQHLYWVSPHVTFSFAATSSTTVFSHSLQSLAAKLEALRQGQSIWAVHIHPLHGLALALFMVGATLWLKLWRDTKHSQPYGIHTGNVGKKVPAESAKKSHGQSIMTAENDRGAL